MKRVDGVRLLSLLSCLPSSMGFGFGVLPSLLCRAPGHAHCERQGHRAQHRLQQRGSKIARGSALFGRGGEKSGAGVSKQVSLNQASESDLDAAETRALERLASILTTDDGLRLSGAEMREARSNWVRDIMSTGRSRVLTKISSRLAVSVLVASTVAAVSNWSPEGSWWLEVFQVPGWPHELVGGFLAILLVFRTDQAYGRFWEGRTQWSTMAAEIRSLARITVANRQIKSTEYMDEVLAHLSAFPVSLKQHLRGENNPLELEAIYEAFGMFQHDSVRRILRADNAPLIIMMALSTAYNAMIRGDASNGSLSQSLWCVCMRVCVCVCVWGCVCVCVCVCICA